LFRHEHRPFSKLHRRYYGLHLSKLESLFENTKSDKAKTTFLQGYEPDTNRLASFKQIVAEEQQDVVSDEEDDWKLTEAEEREHEQCYEDYHQIGVAEKQTSECNQSAGHNSSLLNTSEDTTNSGGLDNDSSSCGNKQSNFATTSIFSQLMLEMMLDNEEAASSDAAHHQDEEHLDKNDLDVSLSSIGLDFVSIDD
jgi:hypothetical protein